MSGKSEFYNARAYFEGLRNVVNGRMLINDRNLFITERYNHFIKRLIERVPNKHHICLMEKVIAKISRFNFDNKINRNIKVRFDEYNVVVCLRPSLVYDRLCVTVATVYNQNEHLHS